MNKGSKICRHLCHMCKDGKSTRVVSHTFMLNKHRVYCCPTCAADDNRKQCGMREMTVEELKGLMPDLEIKPSRHHVRVRLSDYIRDTKRARQKNLMSDSELLDRLLNFVEKEADLEDTLKVVCDSCGLELTYTFVVAKDQILAMTDLCKDCEST